MQTPTNINEPLLSAGETQGKKLLSIMGQALSREVQGYNLNAQKSLTMCKVVPRDLNCENLEGNVMNQEDIQGYLDGDFGQTPTQYLVTKGDQEGTFDLESNQKNVDNLKAQLSIDIPKFSKDAFELGRKDTLLDSQLKSLRESYTNDEEFQKLRQEYNDETTTTDQVFFENTNMKAIDFSTRRLKFDDPIHTNSDSSYSQQSCYYDPETESFKYVLIRASKEQKKYQLQIFDQDNGQCTFKTQISEHSEVNEKNFCPIFINNAMFFIKTFEDKFEIWKFDFVSKEESMFSEYEAPSQEDTRHKLKLAFFVRQGHDVAQWGEEAQDETEFMNGIFIQLCYGAHKVATCAKIEIRQIQNIDECLFAKAVRSQEMTTRHIRADDLQNDKITLLQGIPDKYKFNDYLTFMTQSQVIILKVENGDEGLTITDMKAEQNKNQLGEFFNKFKEYIDLVNLHPLVNFKKVEIAGSQATQETILTSQYRLAFLKPYKAGKHISVLQIFESGQYKMTKLIFMGKLKNTNELLEYGTRELMEPEKFTDLEGMKQLIFMPRVGQDKAFENRYPCMTYYSKHIKNQVTVLDPDGVPIIYQKNESGEIIKIKDTKSEIVKSYPMLVGDKLKEGFKPNELMNVENTHILGNFNLSLYKPNKEDKQGYFFLDSSDMENLKVNFEHHTFKELQKLPKAKRFQSMAVIMPKVQRLNDDSSQRVMLVMRHSLQGAPNTQAFNSFSKGMPLETFLIVFDLAEDKIIYQHQIKNELVPEKLSRYNLQIYVTLEQSSETIVTKDLCTGSLNAKETTYRVMFRRDDLSIRFFQDYKFTNFLEKGNEKIHCHLVGLQMLVLDSSFEIECKYDRLTNETYPLLDEDNNIRGQQLMLRDQAGDMKIIQLANKTDFEYKFHKQSLTLSTFQTYAGLGTLFEAKLTDLMQTNGVFSCQESYRILYKQLQILMSLIPFNVRDFVQQSSDQVIEVDLLSPYEMLHGNTIQNLIDQDPENLEYLSTIPFKSPEYRANLPKFLLERILAEDPSNKRVEGFVKMNLLNFDNDIDLSMGVNQISMLKMILETGNTQASTWMLSYMTRQKNFIDRERILMINIETIFKLELGEVISPVFETQVNLMDESAIEELSFANVVQSTKLKQYLDEELIVQLDGRTLMDYDPRENIVTSMMDLDSKNCKAPEFPVEHSFFDFSDVILGRKLKQVLTGDDFVFQHIKFTEHDLAYFLHKTYFQTEGNIDKQKVVRNLIDYQFETHTEDFFKKQVMVYFCGYVLPIFVQLYQDQEVVSAISLILCLLTQFYLFSNEIIQMQEGGLKDYFSDKQNRIDTIMFAVNVAYCVRRFFNLDACYMPDDKGIINVYKGDKIDANEEATQIVAMTILTIFIITMAAFKLMFYLKIYESFGMLVTLVTRSISDTQTFNIYLLAWMFYFCQFYKIAGVVFDNGDYPEVGANFVNILQTYRNSIGDIAAPTYPLWEDFIANDNVWQGKVMIFTIWSFWFIHQYLILIILLNFLIAIISGSYEDVMAQEIQLKYQHRCEMNLECLVVLNKKRNLPHFNKMILATPKNDDSDDEMKNFIDKRNKAISDKLISAMESNRKDTQQEIKSMKSDMKAMEARIVELLKKND